LDSSLKVVVKASEWEQVGQEMELGWVVVQELALQR